LKIANLAYHLGRRIKIFLKKSKKGVLGVPISGRESLVLGQNLNAQGGF
jgi:hypothetical protein